jgi:starch phosphorylase
VGLNYHYGLFHQRFVDLQQARARWLAGPPGLAREDEKAYTVSSAASVKSRLYDIDVLGYGSNTKNSLRLFDLESVDDSLVPVNSIDFDKGELEEEPHALPLPRRLR